MDNGVSPIRDITKEVIKNLSGEKRLRQEKIKDAWRKAAGERFGGHSQVASFREKRLVVNVDSSAWLYELSMRKKELAGRLKERLGADFEELQFRIGAVED